jgi:hypothetical protein
MPATISTSLTTGDTRAYVYPENVDYVVEPPAGNILYTMVLMPRPKHAAS